jgi:hypothetical protein
LLGGDMAAGKRDYHRLFREESKLQHFGVGTFRSQERSVKRSFLQTSHQAGGAGLFEHEFNVSIGPTESADS